MKTTTSITLDSDKLKKLRDDGIVLSQWVNQKLDEYAKAKHKPAEKVLTSQEAKMLYETSLAREEAIRKANEEEEEKQLNRTNRISFLHKRLNQLTEEKMKAKDDIAIDIILDEQKELHRELNELEAIIHNEKVERKKNEN